MNGFLSVLSLIPPLLAKLLFDAVYPRNDTSLLLAVVVVTLGVTIGSAILSGIKSYASQITNTAIDRQISRMFFERALALHVRYYDEHHAGSIHARLSDVRSSLSMLLRVLDLFFNSTLQLLLVPAALFWLDWRLALISLAAIPVTTLVSTASAQIQKPWSRQTAEHAATITSLQIEAYSNVRTVKLLNAQGFISEQLQDLLEALQRLQLRSALLGATTAMVNATASGAATAVFTYVGWREVLSGSLTIGGLMAFSSYSRLLSAPFNGFASIAVDIQRASVAISRVFEFFDSPTEESPSDYSASPSSTVRLDTVDSIELFSVGYEYRPGQKVVRDLSLKFDAGESVAMIGRSGAGKSTILRLLARLDHPMQGEIRVNGSDYTRFPLSLYRSRVAVVWQEPSMLSGTLLDNLLLGIPSPSPDRIQRVLDLCQLDDFVRHLPEGLSTRVGQGGSTVSGGQRQRIAIARAVLRDPAVLILDEATANVDEPTEQRILEALLRDFHDKILIFVTHRSSTVRLAHRTVSIDDGSLCTSSTEVRMRHPSLVATR